MSTSGTARSFDGHDSFLGIQSVKRLQIKASRLVNAIFTGEYRSTFRGRGLEFDEVREYQAGDDVRSLDWNVTARQGRPFIKRFVEERELSLVLLLDRSLSMHFGTVRASKIDVAVEACALLAFAALRSHDKMSLLTFGRGDLSFLRPAKGKHQALRLIAEAMTPAVSSTSDAGLDAALDHLQRIVKGRCLVCIFSDFIDPLPTRLLAAVAARHEVVAVLVRDRAEHELPMMGQLHVVDRESGLCYLIDTDSSAVLDHYRRLAAKRFAERRGQIISSGADFLELHTQESPLHQLLRFFNGRHRSRNA